MEGFWILTNIPDICITQGSENVWIWLNGTWINCSNYGRVLNIPGPSFMGFKYALGSKYARDWNMARFWKCKSRKEFSLCLNKPEYAIIMPQYPWSCLNNAEYAWICNINLNKHSSEYMKILNRFDAVLSIKSLSSYWDRGIQNAVRHLRWSPL